MLYIIRHGRTDWNDMHKLQGRTDTNLNVEGIKMAEEASEESRDVHFDVCFCSPLNRAKQTAEILLKGRDVPVIYDDRLMEMCFGSSEGETNCFEHPESPVYTFFMDPANYDTPPEGAESMQELFDRTGAFLKEAVDPLLAEGKDVLIVGHGAMNSSIICQVKGRGVADFWKDGIANCKLMKLK